MKKLVIDTLNEAIHLVYKVDRDVLMNKVIERCVCARLALHLESLMRQKGDVFLGYYADVEYDRMANADPKHIVGEKKHVCDLLIHSRGHKEPDNLLALEIKVHNHNSNVECDICRLKHIVQHSNEHTTGYVRDTLIGVFLRMQEQQYKYRIFDGDVNDGEPSEEITIPIQL